MIPSSQTKRVVIIVTRESNNIKYKQRVTNNPLTCHDIVPTEHTHIVTINLITRHRVTTTYVTLMVKTVVICHHHSSIIVAKGCILGNTVITRTICSSIVCVSSIGSGGHRRRTRQTLCCAAALEERNEGLFRTVRRLRATAAAVGQSGRHILTTQTVDKKT